MSFDTPYVQKEYCTLRCRRAAKLSRAMTRDGNRAAGIGVRKIESEKIPNPTLEQLSGYALMFMVGNETEPKVFVGEIPNWTPPTGVHFIKSLQADPPEYWMTKDLGMKAQEGFMENVRREVAAGGTITLTPIEPEKPVAQRSSKDILDELDKKRDANATPTEPPKVEPRGV
jgi:hypothetical protein